MPSKKSLHYVCQNMTLIILSILILCLYPLFIAFFVPLLIYRFIVNQVAKWDPKVGNMLSGIDANFAAHNTYTKPSCVIIPYYSVTSKVDIKQVINIFTERVLKPKNNNGQCIFPELKQKIVRKYGYMFWYDVDDFKVENHFRYLNPENPEEVVYRSEVPNLIQFNLTKLPFNSATSPWEFIIIPNFIDESDPTVKSLIMFRFSHCIMDAYSWLNFTEQCGVKAWKKVSDTGKSKQLSNVQSLLRFLIILLSSPYYLMQTLHFSEDTNDWQKKVMVKASGTFSTKERLIPVAKLKSIKDQLKVSFSSVIISLVAGAVVRTMERKNISTPSKIHITFPWPLPGHPKGLTNHWTAVKMPLEIYKDDPIKTLKSIEREYENLRHSVFPFVVLYLTNLVGSLPAALIPENDSLITSTCLLSNFPCPGHQIDLFGYEVRDISLGGTPSKGYAVANVALSYNGNIRLVTGGDVCNLTDEGDADFLADSFIYGIEQIKTHG